MNLDGKVAIVTAAGRGIGKGIATCLATSGARLVVNSYGADTTAATVAEIIAAGGDAIGVPGDATQAEPILDIVDQALKTYGHIDILVNNVGAGPKNRGKPSPGPLGPVEATWTAFYQQNLLPTVLMTEAVVPHMKTRHYGKIVHISSLAGRSTMSDTVLERFTHPSYGAMKAAIINYMQTLAESLGKYNINVNAVCPGIVYTDSWKAIAQRTVNDMPEYQGMEPRRWFEGIARGDYPEVFDRTPMRREQTVEDIGQAVKFLVSSDSMNITGQSLMVDGGMVKI